MKVKKLIWEPSGKETLKAIFPWPNYDIEAKIAITESKNDSGKIISYTGTIWTGYMGFKIADRSDLESCKKDCENY